MNQRLFITLLITALVLLLASVLMFYVEVTFFHVVPRRCLMLTSVLSVLYFNYSLLSVYAFEKLFHSRSKLLTSFHLLNTTLRFMISILTILIYYLIFQLQDFVVFIFNLMVFYVIVMVSTSVHFIKTEKVGKKQK